MESDEQNLWLLLLDESVPPFSLPTQPANMTLLPKLDGAMDTYGNETTILTNQTGVGYHDATNQTTAPTDGPAVLYTHAAEAITMSPDLSTSIDGVKSHWTRPSHWIRSPNTTLQHEHVVNEDRTSGMKEQSTMAAAPSTFSSVGTAHRVG